MKKILIVDDSNSLRMSLSFSLGQKGYEILTAADGREGLAQVMTHNDIELVITDINMPQMDGYQLIENIRLHTDHNSIPILALSADEEKGNKAISIGATAFIIKSSHSSQEISRFLDLFIK